MTLSERLKKFDMFPNDGDEFGEYVSPELVSLCEDLTKSLSKKIATIPIWFDYTEEEQKNLIQNFLNTKLNEQFSEIKLTTIEKDRITNMFFNNIYGFGSLDFLLARKDISKILVNSPDDIFIETNGEIEKTDVVIDSKQFDSLVLRLFEISGKTSPVLTFRLNNLLITIIREPVCETKLILKKVKDANFNLEYFERREIINNEILEFIKSIIPLNKKIIISAPAQCGKTSFLNALIQEIPENNRAILFEEGALINTNRSGILRFDIEDLTEREQQNLINAALYYKPDYIFSDINSIGFNIELSDLISENCAFFSTVRAKTVNEVISFYTSLLVSRLKCTEKLAKRQFAKEYDYIIQLEQNNEDFIIKSIVEITANKVGTPALRECLSYKSGKYKYNFEHYDTNDDEISPEDTPRKSDESNTTSIDVADVRRKLKFSNRFSK